MRIMHDSDCLGAEERLPIQSFGAKVRRGCLEVVAPLQTLKAEGWWQVVSEEGTSAVGVGNLMGRAV